MRSNVVNDDFVFFRRVGFPSTDHEIQRKLLVNKLFHKKFVIRFANLDIFLFFFLGLSLSRSSAPVLDPNDEMDKTSEELESLSGCSLCDSLAAPPLSRLNERSADGQRHFLRNLRIAC